MPRNRGTSRKGKPGKADRAAGMGKALQKAQGQRYRPRENGKNRRGDGGMAMQEGVHSVGVEEDLNLKTRSVLELNDLDDFLVQADLAHREFASEKEGLVVLDPTSQAYRPRSVQFQDDERPDFVFQELSVPRRPAWDDSTTPDELHRREQHAFLDWRRAIAVREEQIMRHASNSSTTVTPFEKNLEVWRQLWRVLERSDCVVQLVDARNPLFYLSDDLRSYAASLGKPMLVLLNKSDYLSRAQRQAWSDYLTDWDVLFFSAVREQHKLDEAAKRQRDAETAADPRVVSDDADASANVDDYDESESNHEQDQHKHANDVDDDLEDTNTGIETPLTRKQLLQAMLAFARRNGCQPDQERYGNRLQFGLVGFPNVGKSSVINVLVGSSKHAHGVVRVGVASQPGKTKHFQTLYLPTDDDTGLDDQMMLCDCPGLVFPSFVSNTADLIAAGVYPIAQMRDHWPVTRLICQRIPREIINAHYGIRLPTPTAQEMKEQGWTSPPPPSPEEFLGTFCVARGLLAASSGVPDYTRAARMVIQDYATGKLLYCHPPPDGGNVAEFYRETTATALANTQRLRAKLERQQKQDEKKQQQQQQQSKQAAVVHDDNDDTSHDDDDETELDLDLLDFLDDTAATSHEITSPPSSNKQHHKKQKHLTGKKWGKKGRKLRNKDPYGCHSTPDDQLSALQSAGGGVTINAGKHGRQGYTRATTYAGPRAAVVK